MDQEWEFLDRLFSNETFVQASETRAQSSISGTASDATDSSSAYTGCATRDDGASAVSAEVRSGDDNTCACVPSETEYVKKTVCTI